MSLQELPAPIEVVGVVPDKETEAWMLADMTAVATAIGLSKELSSPASPRRLHTVADPKLELAQLVQGAYDTGSRSRLVRRTSFQVERLYSSLAAQVDFATLSPVPAFARYESELRQALRRLELLPAAGVRR